MTGLTQLINIGSTGLEAASQALETISNNTANVNTPGYNVELVQQQQLPGFLDGAGHGVSVTSIQRAFDRFAFAQLVSAGSASQAAQVAQNNAQTLSAMFPVASGGAGGLNAAVDSFFTAMNTVSQDPTSLANRQVFLANAQSLTARLQFARQSACRHGHGAQWSDHQRGQPDQHADPTDRDLERADHGALGARRRRAAQRAAG